MIPRGYGAPAVALVWVVSVAAAVFHIVAHHAPLLPTLLGQGGLFVTALAFGAVGYYTFGRVETACGRDRLARRTLAFFAVTGVASGLYAFHQYLSPEAVLSAEGVVFQALVVGLIGGGCGMFVGLNEIRLTRQHERATALNDVYEVAREITRTMMAQGTRADIERTVCEQLAVSDAYAFAWVGDVEDESGRVVPTASAGDEGYLDEIEVRADDTPAGRGPTGRAIRRNEAQVVHDTDADAYAPWADAAGARGVSAAIAVPVGHDDEQYGVLNVYTAREGALGDNERAMLEQVGEIAGLAIAAVEHEAALANERERLEFINRLIRHNILNGLNVISARSGMVVSGVEDAALGEHAEVVRERADDLSELIGEMRVMMDAVVSDADHELSWRSLPETVETEVSLARATHPDAVFRFERPEGVEVLADRLLGEVFENLLENAVGHNDSGEPVVEVSLAETTHPTFVDAETGEHRPRAGGGEPGAEVERVEVGAVSVAVADNGPGVPAAERDAVLETGVSQLDEPGSGFGLYLVKEMVRSYGGDIDIRESDLGGAVFELTFLTERPG
jgi:signal transduction histidine kinase